MITDATAADPKSTFRPEGELTIFTVAEYKDRLMALLAPDRRIEIDLSEVSELDTAGLQLLIQAKHEASRRGADLVMTGHSPAVTEVFDILNLAAYFGDPIVLPGRNGGGALR